METQRVKDVINSPGTVPESLHQRIQVDWDFPLSDNSDVGDIDSLVKLASSVPSHLVSTTHHPSNVRLTRQTSQNSK